MPDEEKKSENPAPESCEKCAEADAAWKRALADYQNLKKEVAKERAEMGAYALLRAAERFLPVMDNFNTAMAHRPQTGDTAAANWIMGVGFIQKQLEEALRGLGLTPIKTADETFDTSRHEAVGEEESDKARGAILKEVQAGYEVAGKVVRPAKVIVAK